MEERVVGNLTRQGVARAEIAVERGVDIRYVGQLHSVTVPLDEISAAGVDAAVASFHDEHLRQYRYSHPESAVETSALRVSARGQRTKPDLTAMRPSGSEREALAARERRVHFEGPGWVTVPVLDRSGLSAGDAFDGPCVVEELDSTIVLPPGTSATVDAVGNIIITLHTEEGSR
jgi:N-methylhydantoinase A